MKIHKKIISLFLALSIIFSSAVPVFAFENPFQNNFWLNYISEQQVGTAVVKDITNWAFNTFSNNDKETIYNSKNGGFGSEPNPRGGRFQSSFGTDKEYYSEPETNGSFDGDNNKGFSESYSSGPTVYYSPIDFNFNLNFNFNIDINFNISVVNFIPGYGVYELIPDASYDDYINGNHYNAYYLQDNVVSYNLMYYDPSAGYSKNLSYYYQLPDGRNSVDLTADEIFGTVFIYNTVNYGVAVEDENLLGLWHFDGDYINAVANSSLYLSFTDSIEYVNTQFNQGVHSIVAVNKCNLYPTGISDYTIELRFTPLVNVPNGGRYVFINGDPHFSYTGHTNRKYLSGINFQANGIYSIALYVDENKIPKTVFINGVPYPFDYDIDTTGVLHSTRKHNTEIDGENTWGDLLIWDYGDISRNIGIFTELFGFYLFDSEKANEFIIDELRISKGDIYNSTYYTPSVQPFDTSSVLVLPDNVEKNTLAVKSSVELNNIRYGGVRPTYPKNGDLYIYDDGDKVSIQQYQINGWYSVEGLIYDGASWVEISSSNLSSVTTDKDDYIDNNVPTPDNPSDDNNPDDEDETTGLLGSIMEKITGFFTGLLDILFGGILDLITVITDNLTGIIDGFTGITGLIGALFGFLPEQMISVLTTGLAVIIIVVIIKIFI